MVNPSSSPTHQTPKVKVKVKVKNKSQSQSQSQDQSQDQSQSQSQNHVRVQEQQKVRAKQCGGEGAAKERGLNKSVAKTTAKERESNKSVAKTAAERSRLNQCGQRRLQAVWPYRLDTAIGPGMPERPAAVAAGRSLREAQTASLFLIVAANAAHACALNASVPPSRSFVSLTATEPGTWPTSTQLPDPLL
jgi:hypothetical protein